MSYSYLRSTHVEPNEIFLNFQFKNSLCSTTSNNFSSLVFVAPIEFLLNVKLEGDMRSKSSGNFTRVVVRLVVRDSIQRVGLGTNLRLS